MTESITVYTTILNGYDHLRPPAAGEGDADFLCYADEPIDAPAPWRLQPACRPYSGDHARNSRVAKILSHLFVDTEYSIWHDGNLQLTASPAELIGRWLGDADIALMRHPYRHYLETGFDCIYKEAETCISRGLFETDAIRRQAGAYRAEGHPPRWGMYVCGFILRRHSTEIRRLNEAWWREIVTYSARDQISFPYVLRKSGLRCAAIDGELHQNACFRYYRHSGYETHPDNAPFAERVQQAAARRLRLSVLCRGGQA